MAKKTGQRIDADEMAALFPSVPAQPTAKQPSPYDQEFERRTYRLRPETPESLKEIATVLGVGLNELVRFVLEDFCRRYAAGEVEVVVGTRALQTHYISRLKNPSG